MPAVAALENATRRRLRAVLFTPSQRIEADPEKSGNQLELGAAFSVLARARVRCNRFSARSTELAIRPKTKTQRGRKAFFVLSPRHVGCIRFAADDQAENAVLASQTLECQNFLVDPLRLRGLRRADHDLACGICERRLDQRPEIRRAGSSSRSLNIGAMRFGTSPARSRCRSATLGGGTSPSEVCSQDPQPESRWL